MIVNAIIITAELVPHFDPMISSFAMFKTVDVTKVTPCSNVIILQCLVAFVDGRSH